MKDIGKLKPDEFNSSSSSAPAEPSTTFEHPGTQSFKELPVMMQAYLRDKQA